MNLFLTFVVVISIMVNLPISVITAYNGLQDTLSNNNCASIEELREKALQSRRLSDNESRTLYWQLQRCMDMQERINDFKSSNPTIDIDTEVQNFNRYGLPPQCENCCRSLRFDLAPDSPYHLEFKWINGEEFSGRPKYCQFRKDRHFVCTQCYKYMTGVNEDGEKLSDIEVENVSWPSFIWSEILSNNDIHKEYGAWIWRLIPLQWRYWWVDAVKEKYARIFRHITIDLPAPAFKDVTEERNEFVNGTSTDYEGKDALGKLRDCCNKLLIPTVFCMYGCSEYIHHGHRVAIEVVYQRYLQRVNLNIPVTKQHSVTLLRGSKNDFIRDAGDEEVWLLNPKWKIFPTISFTSDMKPVVHLCRFHTGRDGKYMIHPPRTPNNVLPCSEPDQLSHLCCNPRTTRDLRRKYGSNGLQMYAQNGEYTGVDTCSVTKFGKFDFCSVINDTNENRIIANRPDHKVIFNNLIDAKVMSPFIAKSRMDRAHDETKDMDFKPYYSSGTYTPLNVCMSTHRANAQHGITFVHDTRGGNGAREHKLPFLPFPLHLYPCQSYDKYGAAPCKIPALKKSSLSLLIQSLIAIFSGVEELWTYIASSDVFRTSEWEGWLLLYITAKCYPHLRRHPQNNPFLSQVYAESQTRFETQFQQVAGRNPNIESMLRRIPIVATSKHTNNNRPTWERMTQNLSTQTGCNVFAVVGYKENDTTTIPDQLTTSNGDKYFLRHVSTNKTSFMRHSDGEREEGIHDGWWEQRFGSLPIQVADNKPKVVTGAKTLVFVKTKSADISAASREFLKYVGGQIKYYCPDHHYPLVASTTRKGKCTNQNCTNPVRFCCPSLQCSIRCCKKCVHDVPDDVDQILFADKAVINSATDDASMDSHICDGSDADSSVNNENDEISIVDSDDDESVGSHDMDLNDYCNILPGSLQPDEPEVYNETMQEFLTTDGVPEVMGDPLFFSNTDDVLNDIERQQDLPFAGEITTTDTGNAPYVIKDLDEERQFGHGQFVVSGHVLLNQCGSLLSRNQHEIKGSSKHHNMIHGLVSTNIGTAVPLVQPEAMLFPSIFWKSVPKENVVLGALPACYLSEGTAMNGFQNLASHIRSRLICPSSTSSTDPRYIAWCYDMLVNVSANRFDTRVAMNRGLTVDGDLLGVRGGNQSSASGLLGSIDSSQMVKNLCASQRYHPMDFFITLTCNQLRHFGTSMIKEWIDGSEWKQHYPGFDKLNETEQNEISRALAQAAGPLILRNWQEVCALMINFLRYAKHSPFKKVGSIFGRNEYQAEVGNLSHIHLMLQVRWNELTEEQRKFMDNLIRADIGSIARSDEVQELIEEGLLSSVDEVEQIKLDAKTFLSHICNDRCMQRVGIEDDELNCRKINYGKVTPDNTQDCYIPLCNDLPEDVKEKLRGCGLISTGEDGTEIFHHEFFTPSRHIPRIDRNSDENISPVESRFFILCRSMQNVQKMKGTGGCNKYVCKYVAKIDEQNYVIVSASQRENGTIETTSEFLHNTKITGSAINENARREGKRTASRPQGRKISMNEMLHLMLKYPEVNTDLRFVTIPTVPLEQRHRIELKADKLKRNQVEDGAYTVAEIEVTRDEKISLATYRKITGTESLMLTDLRLSQHSVDRITEFSLRPPELREVFDQVGNYYRWFTIEGKVYTGESLEELVNDSLAQSAFVDGFRRKVKLRASAIPEVEAFLTSYNATTDTAKEIVQHFISMIEIYNFIPGIDDFEAGELDREFICKHLIDEQYKGHLPVPVYSYTRPTNGHKFILHVLLSMGHFTTEPDLTMHASLRECFRAAKLIGPSNEEEDLRAYSAQLLRRFIEEQLVYFSNSRRVLGEWIVLIGEIFDSIIIYDEMLVTDMPSVQMSSIIQNIEEEMEATLKEQKAKIIDAAKKEFGPELSEKIPLTQELLSATLETPCVWDPVASFEKASIQNEDSYAEQLLAVKVTCAAIDKYVDLSRAHKVSKNIGIRGFPGGGKTYTGLYCVIYAISKGLNCITTAIMGTRAAALGGIHWHKLLGIPCDKNLSPQRIAELALNRLDRDPILQNTLRSINVIFADELGQLSAEFVSTINFILCRVRGNGNLFGGCLLIGTLDHTQIQPWDGRPFLASPMIIPTFDMVKLEHSVRTNDSEAYELQQIARCNYNELIRNPGKVQRFIDLAGEKFTFVESWDDPKITKSCYRVYSKRIPVVEATRDFIIKVKREYKDQEDACRFRKCQDQYRTKSTRAAWKDVTDEDMRKDMNKKFKLGSELCFFKGAVFEATYNHPKRLFLTSETLLLYDIPTQASLDSWKPISLLKVPCGWKDYNFDLSLPKEWYIQNGFKEVKIPVAPTRQQRVRECRTKRKQYGLRHRITGTIHSSMGHTFDFMASEISNTDPKFGLWDKGMLVVLISRTRKPENTIFVGSKQSTLDSLRRVLLSKTMWTDYIEDVLSVVTVNGSDERVTTLAPVNFPFRISDMRLPSMRTGIVYMLISLRRRSYVYIGKTFQPRIRLYNHNAGYGSSSTEPYYLRPFAVMAYISGFGDNGLLMLAIEREWKMCRDYLIGQGINDPRVWAKTGAEMVLANENISMNYDMPRLSLSLLFNPE